MKAPQRRHIENDVSPERERLEPDEVRSIRADCAQALEQGARRLVECSPPRVGSGAVRFARNGPTLYLGLLGQAFGFLHLHERSGKSEQLELAEAYLEGTARAIERASFPPPEQWLSFHATSSWSAIAAVVQHLMGDPVASERHLANYRKLAMAAANPDYPSEDLLWGRGGFLFGAAFLRARLGADSIGAELITPALDAMIATGRRLASKHAHELTPGPNGKTPLLYMNYNASLMDHFAGAIIGSRVAFTQWIARLGAKAVAAHESWSLDLSHRYDLSLVHGLPGNLYLMMQYPDWLNTHPDSKRDIVASLDCLTDYLDAEHGMLELLPSPRSDASQKRRRSGRFTERVHWCGGTPGMVFVFSRAFTIFGHARYLEAAQRAADHVWKHGLVCKGNGICHGIAGNGYAFLALYRATNDERARDRALHFAKQSLSERVVRQQRPPDRPWSLYEGAMGTLCFYADCLDPMNARFPGFEV